MAPRGLVSASLRPAGPGWCGAGPAAPGKMGGPGRWEAAAILWGGHVGGGHFGKGLRSGEGLRGCGGAVAGASDSLPCREEPLGGSRRAAILKAAASAPEASEEPGGFACPLCARVGEWGEAQALGNRGCSPWGGPSVLTPSQDNVLSHDLERMGWSWARGRAAPCASFYAGCDRGGLREAPRQCSVCGGVQGPWEEERGPEPGLPLV